MADIDASLNIYKFLCKKIGNEQIVSLRRLIYTICDIGRVIYPQRIQQVISGSKGEGLNTKGSDMDFMYIDPTFQITESYRNVVLTSKAISIVMDTDETLPCFTKLRFVINDQSIYHPHVKQIMQTDRLGNCLLSSKLFKIYNLRNNHVPDMIIHGPCVSDKFGRFDFAMALKCNEWITPAQHWASRPQSLSEYRRLIACNQISDIEHIRTTIETILPLDTVVTDNQFYHWTQL
ncbi:unnamed protein product [Mytilus coruscus]|uniref:Mab-21-like nucleotidyltransferase domain-containing protein n=1 Tax=Mytilus coruscus TaxID=42192 RepID=A0A6J8CWE0_MYTCO|nr:unnamed protein product [Mytilus coruscus]